MRRLTISPPFRDFVRHPHPWSFAAMLGIALAASAAAPGDPARPPNPGANAAVKDPGPRIGKAGAGDPVAGLKPAEATYFSAAKANFTTTDSISGPQPGQADTDNTGTGLGPRFNSDSCVSCHAQPAPGGSSPGTASPQAPGPNPQIAAAARNGARNLVPAFVTADGPVREARFRRAPDGSRDGGVHALFVVTGRTDASTCSIRQPDFALAAAQNNLSFRIPTPLFGLGLVEAIEDSTIVANKSAQAALKRSLGISGRENRNGNDGTISRFGWKAQNVSLSLFSAEAYNVEMGVTNEVFPDERDLTPGCVLNPTPEDRSNFESATGIAAVSDVVRFAVFMRFLAPPTPAPDTPSIASGRQAFAQVGCALCHTPALPTGRSATAALNGQTAKLYSDLLLHAMGSRLADDIVQGQAGPDEFRTAPLWGLGQRLFFMHDGRTRDLVEAIEAHASHGSEANAVIAAFDRLPVATRQDVLNFLRSL